MVTGSRRFAETATRVLVNGVPGGVAWSPDGSPFAVVSLTVRGERIVAIDILADPERLARVHKNFQETTLKGQTLKMRSRTKDGKTVVSTFQAKPAAS